MRLYRYFFSIISILLLMPAFAQSQLSGFTINNQAINPACVNLTSTWLSDHGIIVRSIVPANCQNSNQAYAGQGAKVDKQGAVCYADKGEHFCYRVIGKTSNGLYVLNTWTWSDDGHGVFSDWRVYRYAQVLNYNAVFSRQPPLKEMPQQKVLSLLVNQVAGDLSGNRGAEKHFLINGNMLIIKYGNDKRTTKVDLSMIH